MSNFKKLKTMNKETPTAAAFIDQLLTTDRINKQINNKSDKPLNGKAAAYRRQLGTCKFKLVCYFNVDKRGVPYTQADKDLNNNRQYIPSFDLYNDGGRQVINHEIAHVQLIDYCLQNASRLQSARLIMNCTITETEQTIFIFNPRQINLSQYVNPIFKDHEQSGGRFVSGLDGEPFRIDKLRPYSL